MVYYSDSDILVINNQGVVQFNLTNGYGQPVKSMVCFRKLDGTPDKITEFIRNTENYNLGNSSLLKG